MLKCEALPTNAKGPAVAPSDASEFQDEGSKPCAWRIQLNSGNMDKVLKCCSIYGSAQ